MGGLIGWLTGAARAEADARHLRTLYGDQAEAWCAGALAALPPGDARRRSVKRIAKALSALTTDSAPAAPIWTSPHAWRAKPVAVDNEACERLVSRKRPNWA